jgi:hypothetical protein
MAFSFSALFFSAPILAAGFCNQGSVDEIKFSLIITVEGGASSRPHHRRQEE